MKILHWLGVVVVVAGLSYWQGCSRSRLAAEGTKLDTVYIERKVTLTKVRQHTDSVLRTDTLFRDTTVQRLIKDERLACDAVVTTCEDRVKNLQKRLKPGWLSVFSEGNYRTEPGEPLLEGTASIRGGASLRLDHDLFLEGYADQPLIGDGGATLNVRVRKNWRIL